MVQRVISCCSQQARLTHAATGHLAHAVGAGNQLPAATQRRAHGRAQTFAETYGHAVKTLGDARGFLEYVATRLRRLHRRSIEQARPIQMATQAAFLGQRRSRLHILKRQQLATNGVLQRQQAAAGEVGIVRLDGGFDVHQRQRTVRLVRYRLWLHATQHSSAAAFPAVGVGHLAHDVLVTALAVGHDGAQVALRAGGHEQGRLKAQHCCDFFLQCVDAGVVGKHVITQRRGQHGRTHGSRRLCHGITAQINRLGSKCISHSTP